MSLFIHPDSRSASSRFSLFAKRLDNGCRVVTGTTEGAAFDRSTLSVEGATATCLPASRSPLSRQQFYGLQQSKCVLGQFFVSTAIMVQRKVTALADRILGFDLPLVRQGGCYECFKFLSQKLPSLRFLLCIVMMQIMPAHFGSAQ